MLHPNRFGESLDDAGVNEAIQMSAEIQGGIFRQFGALGFRLVFPVPHSIAFTFRADRGASQESNHSIHIGSGWEYRRPNSRRITIGCWPSTGLKTIRT